MSFPQIRGFSAVYSSDMIRAQETARILCGQEPPLAET
jgi:broad specificity phosphatase PhoE